MSIYNSIYNFALRLKEGTEHLTYGRHIIREWAVGDLASVSDRVPAVLDIGCGKGGDLDNVREVLGRECRLWGIESYPEYIEECKGKGIEVTTVNVERDRFPFDNASFDVVIANQLLEHTKELFFIVSEISRVLKKGGSLIVGIPNLAAWHDRCILLLGQQPSGCKVLGPHIRAMTKPGLRQFVECDGYFMMKSFRGSGFYPFPEGVSKVLARLFPSLATSIFFKFLRTGKEGTFIDVLKARTFETNYFRG